MNMKANLNSHQNNQTYKFSPFVQVENGPSESLLGLKRKHLYNATPKGFGQRGVVYIMDKDAVCPKPHSSVLNYVHLWQIIQRKFILSELMFASLKY